MNDEIYTQIVANERRVRRLKTKLAQALTDEWASPDFREGSIGRQWWIDKWREVGYTASGRAAPRPTEPLELFRGAKYWHRVGMSWTTDYTIAERFAKSIYGDVWKARVLPWRLLAYVPDRQELEYVVDPRRLKVSQVPYHRKAA